MAESGNTHIDPGQTDSPLPGDPRERAALLAAKKAELEEIAERRSKLLEADLQRKERREAETAAQTAREEAAFAEQAAETKERADEREEWRQGQHEKRREAEKARWLAEEQAKREEEKRKKIAAEKAKQEEYLTELHKRAYRKKVENAMQNAQLQEQNENADSLHRHDRDISAAEAAGRSAETSRSNDRKRQIAALRADAERRRSMAEEAMKTALAAAAREAAQAEARLRAKPAPDLYAELGKIRAEAGRKKMEATAHHKRELMAIEEHLAAKQQEIDLLFDRMQREAERDAMLKRSALDKDLGRRKSESAERRRRTEEHGSDVRLAALFHDCGKVQTFSLKERIRFDHHATVSADLVSAALKRLQCSKKRIEKIDWLVRHHMCMTFLEMPEERKPHWYFHPWFAELLQIFWLDVAGSTPSDFSLQEKIVADYHRYLDAHPRPAKQLLTGDEVMEILGIGPGAHIGKILHDLHEAQTRGEVTTKKEAKEYIQSLC